MNVEIRGVLMTGSLRERTYRDGEPAYASCGWHGSRVQTADGRHNLKNIVLLVFYNYFPKQWWVG